MQRSADIPSQVSFDQFRNGNADKALPKVLTALAQWASSKPSLSLLRLMTAEALRFPQDAAEYDRAVYAYVTNPLAVMIDGWIALGQIKAHDGGFWRVSSWRWLRDKSSKMPCLPGRYRPRHSEKRSCLEQRVSFCLRTQAPQGIRSDLRTVQIGRTRLKGVYGLDVVSLPVLDVSRLWS